MITERTLATSLSPDDPVMRDHSVHGVRIMPGVTFLDLFHRLALSCGFPEGGFELRRILFVEPVALPEGMRGKLLLELRAAGDHWSLTARSKRVADDLADAPWHENARAQLHLAPSLEGFGPAQRGAGPGVPRDLEEIYARMRSVGILHKDFMKCTGTAWVAPEAIRADLKLGDLAAAHTGNFYLQPALLDTATGLSSFAAYASPRFAAKPCVPIYIDRFRAIGRLGSECHLVLPLAAVAKEAALDFSRDERIDFFSLDGRMLARLEGLGFKRIRDSDALERLVRPGAAEWRTDISPIEGNDLPDAAAAVPVQERPVSSGGTLSTRIQDVLLKRVAAQLRVPASAVGLTEGFYELGLESSHLLELVRQLETLCGRELYPTLLFEFPSIAELVPYLAREFPRAPGWTDSEQLDGAASLPKRPESRPRTSLANDTQPRVGQFDCGPIAIVGLSGRYPKASNLDEFWDNLKAGRDCIEEIPAERWNHRDWPNCYAKWGGFIDDCDKFDPLFFNLSPREAEMMDPQERLFLETAWATVEDAGYTRERLRRSLEASGQGKVGVFVGVMWGGYQSLAAQEQQQGNPVSPPTGYWSIANRVSYYFDFRGPSMAVDTACSSSLTALHLACRSLAAGECQAAIAGGVNLTLHPGKYIMLCDMRIASSDGKCRSFGEGGDGYVPGEGVGAVLLKPLRQALADGDRIYGVIRGSAVNHGGRSNGYTVPSLNGQADVISEALREGGIDPGTLSYIEAQGTGTTLGDPVEVAGLAKAFQGAGCSVEACPIGSLKSSIGHLEAAGGIAALTKVLLQMKHGQLAPSLHAEKLNPKIDFSNSHFFVQRGLADWPRRELPNQEGAAPRRAGISTFGLGGSNAHLVVEECQDSAERHPTGPPRPELVLLSAKNQDRLREAAEGILRAVTRLLGSKPGAPECVSLLDISFTLRNGRESMESRLALVAEDLQELAQQLRLFLSGESSDRMWSGSTKKTRMANGHGEAGDEERRYLADLMEGRKLAKLASLWVGGADVDWGTMSRDQARVVSLPTYPFARERYWLPNKRAAPFADTGGLGTMPANPLMDSFEETGEETVYRKSFSLEDPLWRDHRVGSGPVLPAAAILEMARAAMAGASPYGPVSALRHVVITRPIRGVGSELKLKVVAKRQDGVLRFEVIDGLAPGLPPSVHGKYVPDVNGSRPSADLGSLDLKAIQARCSPRAPKAELYAGFKRAGLAYGPAYQVVERLWGNSSEAFSRLLLPAAAGLGLEYEGLAPPLLDGSLQTVSGIGEDGEGRVSDLYLPFSIDKLEVGGFLPSEVFAHAALVDQGKGSRTFEVRIADAAGRVLVSMTRVMMRRIPSAQLFRPTWRSLRAHSEWSQPTLVGPLVALVASGNQLGLVADLWRGAGRSQPVIGVVRSREFRRLRGDYYELNPLEPGHYSLLWEDLKKDLRLPSAVLNLWTWDEDPVDGSDPGVDSFIASGCGAAFLGMQALMRASPRHEARWVQVCRDCATAAAALNRMLVGFSRTLRLEQPKHHCKLVRLSRDIGWEEGLGLVLDELAESAALWSVEVRLGKERTVRSSAAVEMGVESAVPLKKGGTYIITGGAGGLGLIMARGMAQRCEIRIVLFGRSELDARRSELVEGIRGLGSEIRYERVDIRDRDKLDEVLGRIREEWGPISGVVHAAGLVDDALILGKGKDAWDRVLAPKVHGTLHLDAATAGDPLDWFVMFSSVSSEFGNVGQADYAAANSFMDAYVDTRAGLRGQGRRSGRTLSIGWPWWQEGGMTMTSEMQEGFARKTGLAPLSTAAGVDAFFNALQSGHSHVIVAVGEIAKIRGCLGVFDDDAQLIEGNGVSSEGVPTAGGSTGVAHLNGSLRAEKSANGSGKNGIHVAGDGLIGPGAVRTEPAPAAAAIEGMLVEIVSGVLKVRKTDLDLETDLGDFGIDSVSLMELVVEIERAYGLVLVPSVLTQHSSISRLARHLSPLVAAMKPGVGGGPVSRPNPSAQPSTRQRAPAKPSVAPSTPKAGARPNAEPIAVVGASCRFAGSTNPEEFWAHLSRGDHLVREVPEERWHNSDYYSEDPRDPNKTYSKWGSFIADIDAFDAGFFGIKEADAIGMDPQQRILLELTQELFDRSGYSRQDVKGKAVAVFLGAGQSDYVPNRLPLWPSIPQRQVIVNQLPNMAAARLSDFFHLRGPAMSIDTACSASLVALHQACQSLRLGECEMAIAGGIQLLIDPSFFVGFSQAGVLSRSGKCAVFDRNADGMVLGEGAGLVLLKPMSRALADGDNILATILGSALNNDGHTMGLTTPSLEAQQEVIAAAYAQARIDPSSVSYLEAHGTGTALGDPIEIKAASQLFRQFSEANQFCAVGSVKSNLGHLLRAAGIAGFLKVVCALGRREIPPTLHCAEPHPRFRFADSPFYPATRLQEWMPRGGVRRAGISAFGFGGTNCHLLLEEFDPSTCGHAVRRVPLEPTQFHRKRLWTGRPTVPLDDPGSDVDLRELLRGLRAGEISVAEASSRIRV